jgi:serine/threonine-protein kinase
VSVEKFGRYRVTGTLGSGAMGEVYAAVDDSLGRQVAIKTLRSASGFGAQMLDERFRQEARAIAQLSHPGVVQVFDLDLTAEPPYLVMERVSGPSLSERLDAGPLGVGELVPLGIQIARALAAAHAAGVVHRDVKPANILGAGEGRWKLADFGVAKVPDSSLTITGQFVGSPAYASPEALVKGEAGPAGDVFGLGATLYEAAAGRWPRGESRAALLALPPPLHELAPQLTPAVAAAIDRAVALEAAERPSAAELAELLAHAAVEPEPAPAPLATNAPVPARPPMSWRRWAIAGGVAAALAVVAALAARSGSRAAPAPASPPGAELAEPREIRVDPPDNLNGKSARDWSHIVDELRRGHIGGARHKLDDFERKWGATEETERLREQLEALPEDEEEPGPHHKRD